MLNNLESTLRKTYFTTSALFFAHGMGAWVFYSAD